MDRYATVNGNWSSPATWNGGLTLPAVGDNVYANGKTVTLDVDITVRSLKNIALAPAVVGGKFVTSGTRVVNVQYLEVGDYTGFGSPGMIVEVPSGTATVNVTNPITGDINWQTSPSYAIAVTGTAVATINAPSITGGSKDIGTSVLISGNTANVTINANLFGGNADGSCAVTSYGPYSTLVVNGNCTGGSEQGTHGLDFSSYLGFCTINGDLTGGISEDAYGVYAYNGMVRVAGNLRFGTGSAPISGTEYSTIMFQRGEVTVQAPSDDNWPLNTGALITLGGSSGFPDEGIIWPPSALSPTA